MPLSAIVWNQVFTTSFKQFASATFNIQYPCTSNRKNAAIAFQEKLSQRQQERQANFPCSVIAIFDPPKKERKITNKQKQTRKARKQTNKKDKVNEGKKQ